MTRLAALATFLLLFTACGLFLELRRDKVVVRQYEDVAGHLVLDERALGWTYLASIHSSAKHGAPGRWNCLVSRLLIEDSDPNRLRNVIVHELANVVVLHHGEPAGWSADWFAWEGDTKGDAEMTVAEAAWFARFGPYSVQVGDDWLSDATNEAIDFINDYAMTGVFERD